LDQPTKLKLSIMFLIILGLLIFFAAGAVKNL